MKKCLFFILSLIHFTLLQGQETKNEHASSKNAIRDRYDSVISKATVSISQGEFEQARAYFKQAQLMLPTNPYAAKMIHFIDRSIWANNQKRLREQELSRKGEINSLMKNGLLAILTQNYDRARFFYQQVLSLKPVKSQEEFAKRKIEAINAALGTSPDISEFLDSLTIITAVKENKAVSTAASNDTIKAGYIVVVPNRSENIERKNILDLSGEVTNTKTGKINYGGTIGLKEIAQKEAGLKKIQSGASAQKNTKVTAGWKGLTKANSQKEIPVKRKEKRVSLTDAKTIKANSSSREQGKEQTNVDVLMGQAATAINLKNYKEARALYQKVLFSKGSTGKKEFAKMVIIAIDQVIEKEGKKKP